jgi:hypothetical protein
MHYRTLLTPLLLMALHAAAQSPPPLSTLHAVTIRLRPTHPRGRRLLLPRPLPLRRALAIFRSSTSGLTPAASGSISVSLTSAGTMTDSLIFTQSAAGEIAEYLNRHYARHGSPYTALVILRTLWLSDANYVRAEYLRDPDRRLERSHIRLKAEIYAIRDGRYIPVLRFDTVQTAMKKRILQERSAYYEWGVNFALLMNELADSASLLTPAKAEDNRRVDLEDIRQFNASRFNAPIDDDRPARGVYANFEEFRNNTPSIQNFEIKLENHERLLYIRESGNTYYTHDAWGYSDGKDIFVMRDGILFPAWKEGKAFYLPAAAATVNPTTDLRERDYKQRSIYFIDMDTGDIY